MRRLPRALALPTLLLAAACVPEGRPHAPDDQPALTATGDALLEGWRRDGVHLVSPPMAAEGANRLALMLTLASAEVPLEGLFEGRGAGGGWRALEAVFHEEELAVLRTDLEAPADVVELRIPADRAPQVELLTFAAEALEAVALEAPEAVGQRSQGLAADLSRAGILPRAAWGARPRRCGRREVGKQRMAIHHSVTARTRSGGYEPVLRMIQSFHMDGRGYCDVGYHFFVTADGRVWEAREVDVRGGHSGGYNSGNIGIVFVGCFHETSACAGLGGTTPPGAMLDGAARAIAALSAKYGIPVDAARIKGHGEQPGQATACPGSALRARLGDLRARARSAGQPAPPPPPANPPAPPSARCGLLSSNERLDPGVSLRACNAPYQLAHQTDGNLVLYRTDSGEAVWHTHTHGRATSQVVMQADGNLVIYAPTGRALWASGTAGRPGAQLRLQDDGNLVIYQGGRPIWATDTAGAGAPPPPPPPAAPAPRCGRLEPGEALAPGQGVRSCDGRFLFTHQTDGNVVLYRGARALWHTSTHGRSTETLAMQPDGNLVLYAPGARPVWNSGTHRFAGSVLAVQDDGNVVIYAPGARPVFATHTNE